MSQQSVSHSGYFAAPAGFPAGVIGYREPPAWSEIKHELPSGAWVQSADVKTLTRGDRREMIKLARTASAENAGFATVDYLLTHLITAWSYPFPIPAEDPASLDRIPAEDDDAITELILAPANKLLFPKPSTPDDYADETSPTAPAGA